MTPASPSHRVLVALGRIGLALTLGCAGMSGSPELDDPLPPFAPGTGRIVVYQTPATGAPTYHPKITVDGETVGELRPSTLLYADRPPGSHQVSVQLEKRLTAFGEQSETPPLAVTVAEHETVFVQAQVLFISLQYRTLLKLMDPAVGEQEAAGMRQAR